MPRINFLCFLVKLLKKFPYNPFLRSLHKEPYEKFNQYNHIPTIIVIEFQNADVLLHLSFVNFYI